MRSISGRRRGPVGPWGMLLLFAAAATGGPIDDPKPRSTPAPKAKAPAKAGKKAADAPPKTPEEEKQAEAFARLKDEAFRVARAYLVLLDRGKYGESWDAMTADVRKGITRRKWTDLLGKTREPFGEVAGRKLDRVVMRATEVADRHDEAWVYVDLRTAEGTVSSELIIVVLEGGKAWKVNAYYIGDPARFPKPPNLDETPAAAPAAAAK